jgi:hypothetical protein
VGYQTRDLLEAMRPTGPARGRAPVLRVDGGMSASDWTMQFLADILGAPVDRPEGAGDDHGAGRGVARGDEGGRLSRPRHAPRVWIHIGSTPVLAPDGRFLNHSAVIDAAGEIRATYDKVHLFDVQIEGQPPSARASASRPATRL